MLVMQATISFLCGGPGPLHLSSHLPSQSFVHLKHVSTAMHKALKIRNMNRQRHISLHKKSEKAKSKPDGPARTCLDIMAISGLWKGKESSLRHVGICNAASIPRSSLGLHTKACVQEK